MGNELAQGEGQKATDQRRVAVPSEATAYWPWMPQNRLGSRDSYPAEK